MLELGQLRHADGWRAPRRAFAMEPDRASFYALVVGGLEPARLLVDRDRARPRGESVQRRRAAAVRLVGLRLGGAQCGRARRAAASSRFRCRGRATRRAGKQLSDRIAAIPCVGSACSLPSPSPPCRSNVTSCAQIADAIGASERWDEALATWRGLLPDRDRWCRRSAARRCATAATRRTRRRWACTWARRWARASQSGASTSPASRSRWSRWCCSRPPLSESRCRAASNSRIRWHLRAVPFAAASRHLRTDALVDGVALRRARRAQAGRRAPRPDVRRRHDPARGGRRARIARHPRRRRRRALVGAGRRQRPRPRARARLAAAAEGLAALPLGADGAIPEWVARSAATQSAPPGAGCCPRCGARRGCRCAPRASTS